MIISIVVAVADNGVIGRDGGLPWRISSDLKTFRRLTMGKPLIMGRRTFQSLKKPLDGRDNIVVTGNTDYQPQGAITANDFAAALTIAQACAKERGVGEIAVVGGTAVFAAALPVADRIYKTEVHGNPAGDATFPAVDWSQWQEVSREALPRGPSDDYAATLVVLYRRRA
ncbi:MAG: dihydrofolate reductase [Hyphomicrobium sp.]|uniref:dihydrofolate reductase n=1 Tax=Hyphomicrobium sp. TaxID=82 RepID=UPI001320A8B8|nr:dihydrofolate reductase [Hyphomicrobium sp.]KAB2938733.1 MAG: dihydrofolate reductase [Hyphomicrobium sp.]MBZ0209955.1 dihydrofolate reductase [Hyphomicrobium sp.]